MLRFDWQELEKGVEKRTKLLTFFESGSAISIGSFDGLHKGHRALLKKLIKEGKTLGVPCGVFTFICPPRYLFQFSALSCISTLRLKLENLEKLGLDFVILVDFSLNFAKMSGEDFVCLLKEYINLKYLLVGDDFRFGRERSSSIEDMRELSDRFSFSFEAFSSVHGLEDGFKISSSFIRKAIYDGDLKIVSTFLHDGLDVDLLNIKPYITDEGQLCFLKEELQQVLPRSGEFLGVLSFSNRKEKDVKVLFDDKWVKLIFTDSEFNEGMPHFNILKLKEKFKE